MNHHYPDFAPYITTVLGFSLVIIIAIWFFIHYLRVGLNSPDAVVVDKLPTNDFKAHATHSESDHH